MFGELVEGDPDRRLAIARAYLALERGEPDAAAQWLASVEYRTRGGLADIRHHLRQLQAAGVALPIEL